MPFDQDSGLVYRETKISACETNTCKAGHSDYTSSRKLRYEAPEVGVQALSDIATRHLLSHLNQLTPEALKSLPILSLERLWKLVLRSGLDTVFVWKLFAQTGCFGSDSAKSWNAQCPSCQRPTMVQVIELSNSAQLHWLTDLSLGSMRFSIAELMHLSKLRNLRSLCIRSGQADENVFSDSIIKAWSREAKDDGAFKCLQMLFLDTDVQMSGWCFQHLNDFPALDTFVLCKSGKGLKLKSQARLNGWQSKASGRLMQYMLECHVSDHAMYWTDIVQGFISHRRAQRSPATNNRPVLSVHMGTKSRKRERLSPQSVAAFERDWKFKSPSDACPPVQPSPCGPRKVKGSKVLALDQLLDGF